MNETVGSSQGFRGPSIDVPPSRSREPSLSKDNYGPYQKLVFKLIHRYPVLNYLIQFTSQWSSDRPVYPVRATVLEFWEDRVQSIDFTDGEGTSGFEKLRLYLESPHECRHRLYLLEDLHPSTIELMGHHLNIDGTVFAHQIRATHWSGGPYNGDTPKLPSCSNPENGFSLRYYEALLLDEPELLSPSAWTRTIGNVTREVTLTMPVRNWKGQQVSVGYVRRNTSFWSQKDDNDGSWNGVILTDPPISQTAPIPNLQVLEKIAGRETWEDYYVKYQPFQKGYRDFDSWPSISVAKKQQLAPGRKSLLDDISYYWSNVATTSQINSAFKSPFNACIFQLQIIASIWMNTFSSIHATLSELETYLWELQGMMKPFPSDDQKDAYLARFTFVMNEVNTLRRRLTWYVSQMSGNLTALDISPSSPPSSPQGYEKDFLHLYTQLQSYQSWSERLMDVITNHVSLMETDKTESSISNSRSISRLTVLGFFFVPVSFVASLFSIGGDFAVGQRRFWIFWVVAVGVVAVSFGVGFRQYWKMGWRNW